MPCFLGSCLVGFGLGLGAHRLDDDRLDNGEDGAHDGGEHIAEGRGRGEEAGDGGHHEGGAEGAYLAADVADGAGHGGGLDLVAVREREHGLRDGPADGHAHDDRAYEHHHKAVGRDGQHEAQDEQDVGDAEGVGVKYLVDVLEGGAAGHAADGAHGHDGADHGGGAEVLLGHKEGDVGGVYAVADHEEKGERTVDPGGAGEIAHADLFRLAGGGLSAGDAAVGRDEEDAHDEGQQRDEVDEVVEVPLDDGQGAADIGEVHGAYVGEHGLDAHDAAALALVIVLGEYAAAGGQDGAEADAQQGGPDVELDDAAVQQIAEDTGGQDGHLAEEQHALFAELLGELYRGDADKDHDKRGERGDRLHDGYRDLGHVGGDGRQGRRQSHAAHLEQRYGQNGPFKRGFVEFLHNPHPFPVSTRRRK